MRRVASLFNDVPPMSEALTRETLMAELKAAPERVFQEFDWVPIAAASVAQVHRAITREGEQVAIKLQRRDIDRIFAADIRILVRLAGWADRFGLIGPQSATEAVREFERFTAQELDFRLEGQTADRLRAHAGEHEYAPRIYWELTTRRMLTMEFIEGHRLSDVIAGRETGLDPADLDELARNLALACLQQLFVTGFFHADPHPGNIILLQDRRVCFIDFGIFGELPRSRREALAGYIENVAIGNFDAAYRLFLSDPHPDPGDRPSRLAAGHEQIFRGWMPRFRTRRPPRPSVSSANMWASSWRRFDAIKFA